MIAEFYKNCEIFITGGSGVVGKAAIEKLLRSCEVKKIYLLIRCKKGLSPEERLKDMKTSRIFDVLKRSKPNELDKLVAIPGDTTLDGLGISPEHRELMKNVSVFFHSAATTRFDEPLKMAIRLNIKSTHEALKLAETLRNLKIFIHVSTFFSNPHLKYIQDKVYPAVFDWRTALKMLESEYDGIDPVLSALTQKFITGFPNTYIFTKHVAEKLVDDYRVRLPVAIFRPSIGKYIYILQKHKFHSAEIVVASLEEPEPGFTETSVGVMGMILVWGAGIMQVLLCNKNGVVDFTPLDIGTKMLLIFTARSAQLERERFEEDTPVGTTSSHGLLRHNFGQIGNCITKAVNENPFEKSVMIPGVKLTASPFIFWINTLLLQILPSALIDGLLKLAGRKPFLMQIQRKVYITAKVLSFFVSNEYKSDGPTDFQELLRIQEGTDFDIAAIKKFCNGDENFEKAIELIAGGCRKYLLNEDKSTLPKCRMILKAKKIASVVMKILVLYAIGCVIYQRMFS